MNTEEKASFCPHRFSFPIWEEGGVEKQARGTLKTMGLKTVESALTKPRKGIETIQPSHSRSQYSSPHISTRKGIENLFFIDPQDTNPPGHLMSGRICVSSLFRSSRGEGRCFIHRGKSRKTPFFLSSFSMLSSAPLRGTP